jgi:predicted phage baseplate assembly protein
MPIRPPALDDRSYDDLVAELLARIPAHTPEWTNPVPGDPGVTLLELFAWLGDTILYRANLIPERQRLAFLRLLGVPLRPAIPARGLIACAIDDENRTTAVELLPPTMVTGPVAFETLGEVSVLPLAAEAYYKRALSESEEKELAPLVDGLRQVYRLPGPPTPRPKPYVTTPVFANGVAEASGFDLIGQTVDKALWLALLAPKKDLKEDVGTTLGRTPTGARQLLNVGVVPTIQVPSLLEGVGPRAALRVLWEVTALTPAGDLKYLALDVDDDTSAGLTRPGVVRLALPSSDHNGKLALGAPSNDVRTRPDAGVGDQPPRLDDPAKQERLIAWLRLRPAERLHELLLSWIGINAVDVDQRQTIGARVVGESDGLPNKELQLPATSVDPNSLELEVEDPLLGYQRWTRVDDLALVGRDPTRGRTAAVYMLDAQAGTIRFGDGVLGRIPDVGSRVRVAYMRAGGGATGNLAPHSLTGITAPGGIKLNVLHSVATVGGADAETLAAAEQRIPARLRDGDRAVTEADYRRLATDTPGVRMGRVEVLPRFGPRQPQTEAPGVVSVMTLPAADGFGPRAPRPDRPFLETVHRYLDERRPVGTELHVIGCEYKPVGVSAGIAILEGFGRDAVLQAVRDALQALLWPLAPGGITGSGWPLGRSVRARELEVAAARVAGVSGVDAIRLFEQNGHDWSPVGSPEKWTAAAISLERWQLPELLSLVVVEGAAPNDLRGVPNPFAAEAEGSVAVPVVPTVC